jgi:hypothetical protein
VFNNYVVYEGWLPGNSPLKAKSNNSPCMHIGKYSIGGFTVTSINIVQILLSINWCIVSLLSMKKAQQSLFPKTHKIGLTTLGRSATLISRSLWQSIENMHSLKKNYFIVFRCILHRADLNDWPHACAPAHSLAIHRQ